MSIDRLYRVYASAPKGLAKERLADAVDNELHRYLVTRVDEQRVEDLAQSANETVWAGISSFRPRHRRAFGRWVQSIARILVLRERRELPRRSEREIEFDSEDFFHPAAGPSTELRWRERAHSFESELARLGTPQRRALEDQLAGGDVRSFASREGLPAATVRTHRRRAREALRRRLAARERIPSTRS